MSNKIAFAGFEEFTQALRDLPAHLAREAASIVTERALSAGVQIEAEYRKHDESGIAGDLSSKVKVDHAEISGAGAIAHVRSTSKIAYIFENGTQVRHTGKGANRGAMPPGHVFVPIVVRERREMREDLIGMLQTEGLEVHGQ